MNRLVDYFHPLHKLNRARSDYLSKHQVPEILNAILSVPISALEEDPFKLDYLVINVENSTADVQLDSVLSIASLPISQHMIDLKGAQQRLVCSEQPLTAETLTDNHIEAQVLAEEGEPLTQVMHELLAQLQGKILVVHDVLRTKALLDKFVADYYQLPPLPLLYLDIVSIEQSLLAQQGRSDNLNLALSAIRKRHDLPDYSARGTLMAALATGELYLALLKKQAKGASITLRNLPIYEG